MERRFKQDWPIWVVSSITLANGVLSIVSILAVRFQEHPQLFHILLPFGLHQLSRSLTLIFGFMLVYLSIHLFHRKRVAWWLATILLVLLTVAQIGRGYLVYTGLAPAGTVALLLLVRKRFTVRSEPTSITKGLALVAISLSLALAYGTLGFWLLHKNDFGIEFHLVESFIRTLREFTLLGNSDLIAQTRHARWFLNSLRILGVVAWGFAAYSLFRPVTYRLKTWPHERLEAKGILENYGRSSLDFFKLWPDKAYYFSEDRTCVIAYRVTWGVALCLGDPVGPPEQIEQTLRSFLQFCANNGWRVAFQHILPDLLELYRQLGFDIIKIGEEAIVDLEHFVRVTSNNREFRQPERKMDRRGYKTARYIPPHPLNVVNEVESVSREWLSLPGRHERGFTLGQFDRTYINQTPLFAVLDPTDHIVAFVNEIPTYRKGDTTVDLMRHRTEIPNGAMDYLFLKLLISLKERGSLKFNFGLAPLAGVGEDPGSGLEEHAVHLLFEHLNRFFSFKGLRNYKDKYEPTWEDRFLAYQGGPLGLLKATLALIKVTEGWRVMGKQDANLSDIIKR
jgi:phosphatidylglycerol lysyltransferase